MIVLSTYFPDHGSDEKEPTDSDSDSTAPLQSPQKTKRSISQVSTSSSTSSQLASHFVDFAPGQVYNESRSKQIHVSPCRTTSDIDISLVLWVPDFWSWTRKSFHCFLILKQNCAWKALFLVLPLYSHLFNVTCVQSDMLRFLKNHTHR